MPLGLLSAAPVSALYLASDVANFIPPCARTCLVSFLNVNYDTDTCGTITPGLDCLCAARGPSGYALGEGAVQCIVAERQVGFCSDNEASRKFGRRPVRGRTDWVTDNRRGRIHYQRSAGHVRWC